MKKSKSTQFCNKIVTESSGKLTSILESIEKRDGLSEREDTEEMVRESSLGRVWQHIEDPESTFVIISASRSENDDETNDKQYKRLKSVVVDILSLGYIEMKGGYVETNDDGEKIDVYEQSLMIPKIKKEDAIELGTYFKQESILFKDKDGMAYIITDPEDENSIGTVQTKFNSQAGNNNFAVSKGAVEQYFSELNKKKFAFTKKEGIIEESIKIYERTPHDNFVMIHSRGNPGWDRWTEVFPS